MMRAPKRILKRLDPAGEHGVALVIAVLILAVISIATASVIFYTDGSQRDAFSKKSGQSAYSLAQAALANATASLLPHYYDNSGQPFDNSHQLSEMVSWAPSGSEPTGCSTASPSPTCTTWSTELRCPAGIACSPGAPTISPVSPVEKARWHITATGAVFNPSGTQPITRTITVDVPVLQPPAKAAAPDIFKSVYSGKVSTGCDLSTGQNVIWAAPVYVKGNLCIGQGSGVEAGPQNLGRLVVGGWVETSGNGAHIGTSSAPLSSLDVGGVCTTSSTVPPPSGQPCADTLIQKNGYWTDNTTTSAATIFASAASADPTFPALPAIDWSSLGNPGTWSCNGGRSLIAPPPSTFVLNGSPYSCTISTDGIQTGSLSWDGTTLTVNGNVWISGNLVTQSPSPQFVYQGLGTIYVGGTVSFANNTTICVGQTDPTGHDCPNKASWPNIDQNFLVIASKGDMSGGQSNSNFNYEGGLYSDQSINFGSGQTNIYGPIVTPDQIFPGQQAASGFPDIVNLFTGLPGTAQPFWVLGPTTNGTY